MAGSYGKGQAGIDQAPIINDQYNGLPLPVWFDYREAR